MTPPAPVTKPPSPAVASTAVFRKDVMKGKVVFVTGGGSGIGLGICKAFAAHGAKIAICGRTLAKLQKAAAEIGGEVLTFQADVRDYDRCVEVVGAIGAQWGRIDVLVNCAAGNFMSLAEDLSPNAYKTVMDIDLRGTFHMSKAALPWLSRADNGSCIINISATLQYTAQPFQAHAASAKAGIDVLTNTLGTEWAEYGIRVVGIAPGPVAGTEGGPTGRVFGEMIKGMGTRSVCPVGRMGELHDIANAAVFLASPAATWITSTTLVVDGASWHHAGPLVVRKEKLRSILLSQKKAHRTKKANSAEQALKKKGVATKTSPVFFILD